MALEAPAPPAPAWQVEPALIASDLEHILQATGRSPRDLVAILRGIQERYRFLPPTVLQRLAELTSIPPSRIEGVATFYPGFRSSPAGLHRVHVCVGTACYVKGADRILDAFRSELGLEGGQDTDRDGTFTVESTACLGCCMLAPVVRMDEVTVGHVEPHQVPALLASALEGTPSGGDEGSGPSVSDHGGASIRLCTCTSCRASGAMEVRAEIQRELRVGAVDVPLRSSACPGVSYRAPIVDVVPRPGESFRYAGVTAADVSQILLRHFPSTRPAAHARRLLSVAVQRLMDNRAEPPAPLDAASAPDCAFWKRQVRIVTEDTGTGPLDLDGYAAAGGFQALQKCRSSLEPGEVVRVVRESGLRGRGGAGYPTGRKWGEVRDRAGGSKSVVCNADEGDPGAFMDRLVLESFPFRVIEGMAIAAYAVGADRCLFYIRSEYPLAVRRISRALEACRDRGVLRAGGPGAGPGVSPTFEVVEGAGAFVCGEETAMIAAIEGTRGCPRPRPPYPAQAGLEGEPTLVNNVETLAAVPWIIRNGAAAFRAIGTPSSPGTKTFALAGKVRRGGLIEVPMGIPLREVVEEIGGGAQEKRALKAVQIGGPSGGCIPAGLTDIPVDFESLTWAGAMMGSGGMVVLDDTDCMVNVARYFVSFTQRESCGTCTGCRVGTRLMLALLDGLCSGSARDGDVERLEELADVVRRTSLCGLGRSAPNPVLSTLRHFRGEYDEHVRGRCRAGQCRQLIRYVITDACIGCTRCAQRCPSGAVQPRPYERHEIDPVRCVRCGACKAACPSDAVAVIPKGDGRD